MSSFGETEQIEGLTGEQMGDLGEQMQGQEGQNQEAQDLLAAGGIQDGGHHPPWPEIL